MVSVADLMRYIFYLTPVQTPICQNFALWIAKDIKKKPELNRCYLYYYLICTFSPIFQKSYWFLELAFLCVWIKDLAQSIFWTCFTNQPTNQPNPQNHNQENNKIVYLSSYGMSNHSSVFCF